MFTNMKRTYEFTPLKETTLILIFRNFESKQNFVN